jgi:hypothetical protein
LCKLADGEKQGAETVSAVPQVDTLTRREPFTIISNGAIGRVDPIAFAVYAVICMHADRKTHDNSFPSHKTIASEAKVSRASVKRAITALVEEKLISVKKIGRIGKQHNNYTVLPAPTLTKRGGSALLEPSPRLTQSPPRALLEPLTRVLKQEPLEQETSLPQAEGEKGIHSRNQTQEDSRFSEFSAKLERFWKAFNPELTFNLKRDHGQLKEFLTCWPTLTLEDFHSWLENYRDSDRFVKSKRPRQFLTTLNQYADGPLDKFGQPLEEQ